MVCRLPKDLGCRSQAASSSSTLALSGSPAGEEVGHEHGHVGVECGRGVGHLRDGEDDRAHGGDPEGPHLGITDEGKDGVEGLDRGLLGRVLAAPGEGVECDGALLRGVGRRRRSSGLYGLGGGLGGSLRGFSVTGGGGGLGRLGRVGRIGRVGVHKVLVGREGAEARGA